MTNDEGLAAWWADKVGRNVIFRYQHGEEAAGVVTSVNDRYVFVRFGRTSSEACDPRQLRLEMPDKTEEAFLARPDVMARIDTAMTDRSNLVRRKRADGG